MQSNVVQAEVARRTHQGWQIVSDSANGVQLRRPKHFSFLWGAFWFVFGIGLGFILYLLWHWGKKDNYAFVSTNADGTLAVSESKGFLGTVGGWISGYWGWSVSRPKAWQKAAAIGVPVAAVVLVIVIASLSGGGDKKTSATAQGGTAGNSTSANQAKAPDPTKPPKAAEPTALPKYKFRVTGVSCQTDSTNTRECKGTVTNISDKKITDAEPIIHWTGGTDSDLGTVDINPILPGQSSGFTVFTLKANPALTRYTVGFKKVFGEESEFPVEPLAP